MNTNKFNIVFYDKNKKELHIDEPKDIKIRDYKRR
jgi:hypothetical protein